MARADRVVPLSPQLIEDSRAAGVSDKKITYIQNGVDLAEVEAQRQRPVIARQKKRIGFIGQLISRKNIPDLLTVFNDVWQEHGDVELFVLGDGEERQELETRAGLKAASADVHYLGFREDRLALLQSFDLFVMTSTLEGIPRCLMEACAMGVPVAAYNIPGIDQLISHGETGLLAKLGDRGELKEHWLSILEDPEQAKTLADAAREHVYENYSAARMAREYSELFSSLGKAA